MAGKQIKPYKKPYSEIAKDLKPEDVSPVLDMVCACIKNTKGRPCTYPNTIEGLQAFKANAEGYFTYLQSVNSKLEERQQLIPDIEGLALFVGVDRSTLIRYSERGGEWKEVISYIKGGIAYSKKQLALRGKIPPILAIFDLANNHNYHNANEFHLPTDNRTAQEENNDTSLEQRCADLGLIWDSGKEEWVKADE